MWYSEPFVMGRSLNVESFFHERKGFLGNAWEQLSQWHGTLFKSFCFSKLYFSCEKCLSKSFKKQNKTNKHTPTPLKTQATSRDYGLSALGSCLSVYAFQALMRLWIPLYTFHSFWLYIFSSRTQFPDLSSGAVCITWLTSLFSSPKYCIQSLH